MVVCKKQSSGYPGCAFVAIDKTMILGQSISICSGKIGDIRLSVGGSVLRPRQGRCDSTRIPQPILSAMLSQLSIVDGVYHFRAEPAPSVHWAKVCRRSRS